MKHSKPFETVLLCTGFAVKYNQLQLNACSSTGTQGNNTRVLGKKN